MDYLYQTLAKPFLFLLDPETAHEFVAEAGGILHRLPIAPTLVERYFRVDDARLSTRVAGIDFPNPVGLAAGFDKTGELYPLFHLFGFGFIECGTFTRHEQSGNPKPRLFRFPDHRALVNRMGFNNPGADKAAKILSRQKKRIPRGINVGKSKITPLENASEDYLYSIRNLESYADYLAINVSSPNTPELRKLQEESRLKDLLSQIRSVTKKPIFLKIAPDLSSTELDAILKIVADMSLEGIIVCNTTIDTTNLPTAAGTSGGISGAPLTQKSTDMIRIVYQSLGSKISVIGVGGIFNFNDALEKIRAGASLIQIYTGFVYEGPRLPLDINSRLLNYIEKHKVSFHSLIGSATR